MKTMYLVAFILTFWLCFASYFVVGLSPQKNEEESGLVDEIFKSLPNAECDIIVASSSSFHGFGETLSYMDNNNSKNAV